MGPVSLRFKRIGRWLKLVVGSVLCAVYVGSVVYSM
jgi:lipopolysaccharide export LptBFGC system permease protein LptF